MQRSLLAASLSNGLSQIRNITTCDDAVAMMGIIQKLGANLRIIGDTAVISGPLLPSQSLMLDCCESATALRMMSSIVSLFSCPMILFGTGTLKNRPLHTIKEPLCSLGASCYTNEGYMPVTIQGPIRGNEISVNCSESSQFLSGLLMALPLCRESSIVHVQNLSSAPYIAMTLSVLSQFGIHIQNTLPSLRIEGNQQYTPKDITIEGDWSGASFFLVAAAIAGDIQIHGLLPTSFQGDRAILDALRLAGAEVEILVDSESGREIISVKKGALTGFEFNATDCPDLFPPLASLAINCKGTTVLHGTHRLLHKECNRACILANEFSKLGAKISLSGDSMVIEGSPLREGTVNPHGDHRIAMAGAIAALTSQKGISIQDDKCVNKSFPDFFSVLNSCCGSSTL